VRRTNQAAVIASCVALCGAMLLGIGDASVAADAQARPAQQPAAILTVISGDVLLRAAGGDFSSARDGAVLYVGSTLRTSADARAIITLIDGSTVELEPASDITIEDATRSGSTILQLARSLGRSWHVVTHFTTADSRYELRTPASTASVRGIAFEVGVNAGLAGLTTLTEAEARVAATAAMTPILVTPAQAITRAVSEPQVLAQTSGARVRQQNEIRVVASPRVQRSDREELRRADRPKPGSRLGPRQ
jgi:hypothetical protein